MSRKPWMRYRGRESHRRYGANIHSTKEPYTRRLTIRERTRGYLVVDPHLVQFFPPEGSPFKVKVDEEVYETVLEAIPTLDKGPGEPHSHYRVRLAKLKEMPKGVTVVLTRVAEGEYELTLAPL